ncbi:MAG: sigma-70 family RNA polymerase sigma factor [Bacillota bacterium]|nr:sigma-70 family RNA polymerase sigma factor [Bacillota bacterium]
MDVFQKLYTDNYKKIIGYLTKMCNDRELAEDLTQETFYRALLSFYYDNSAYICSKWLVKTAYNAYIDYIRKNKSGIISFNAEEHDNVFNQSDSTVRFAISEAMRHLPLHYKTVIILKDHCGFSYKEIAEITGLSEPVVKVTLHRARKKFKEVYEKNDG